MAEVLEEFVEEVAFKSRTGSSRGVYRQNGEMIAVCHKVMPKSYNSNAPRSDLNSTMKTSFKNPNAKAQLTPYHWNALRNRLPVDLGPEAAIPFVRFCKQRNIESHDNPMCHTGNVGAGYQRFRTTSANFYDYDTRALEVGASNQGIVSEKTRVIHLNQLK